MYSSYETQSYSCDKVCVPMCNLECLFSSLVLHMSILSTYIHIHVHAFCVAFCVCSSYSFGLHVVPLGPIVCIGRRALQEERGNTLCMVQSVFISESRYTLYVGMAPVRP